MRLTVNGETRELSESSTVADLLGPRPQGVAVAVNDEVVPRGAWATTTLSDGDRVEIVEASQGG